MMHRRASTNGPSRTAKIKLLKMSFPKTPMPSPVCAIHTRESCHLFLTKFAAFNAMAIDTGRTWYRSLFKNTVLKSAVWMASKNLTRSNPFAGFCYLPAIPSVGGGRWIRIFTGLQYRVICLHLWPMAGATTKFSGPRISMQACKRF